jgi:hypothetical protein
MPPCPVRKAPHCQRFGLNLLAPEYGRYGYRWITELLRRPMHANHVWNYDIVFDRTSDGRKLRILNVIDEFTGERQALHNGV